MNMKSKNIDFDSKNKDLKFNDTIEVNSIGDKKRD